MTTQRLSGRPVSVYIVDDAANVRERLELLIESIGGMRVVGFAARADAAIEGIRSTHPDVVILDVALARGSGYDVLRSLKGDAQKPLVYMLSNFATQPYRRRAANLGACDFFDKSLELDDLRNCLRQGSQGRNRVAGPDSVQAEHAPDIAQELASADPVRAQLVGRPVEEAVH